MYIIIANFGNDSIALIEWAYQHRLHDVFVLWVNTGWAAPGWFQRVEKANVLLKQYHFTGVSLKPEYDFLHLVRERKNFPSIKFHWCASFLKGLPILEWLDDKDPDLKATILLAKRRQQAPALSGLVEFDTEDHSYSGRRLWHPLYQHTLVQRNQLINQAGFDLLPTRSLECDPCIYNQRRDFLRLEEAKITQLSDLEIDIGKTMFFNGIKIVVEKAQQNSAIFSDTDLGAGDKSIYYQGCGSQFGCGD